MTIKLEKGSKKKSIKCKVLETKKNERCHYVVRFWKEGFPLKIDYNIRIGTMVYKIKDMRMSPN